MKHAYLHCKMHAVTIVAIVYWFTSLHRWRVQVCMHVCVPTCMHARMHAYMRDRRRPHTEATNFRTRQNRQLLTSDSTERRKVEVSNTP